MMSEIEVLNEWIFVFMIGLFDFVGVYFGDRFRFYWVL